MKIIDETDTQIVRMLQDDARISHAAIGKEIGITGPSVYARVKRMEQDGLITGYHVWLDPDVVGKLVTAFIRVQTHGTDEEELAFEEYVRNEPEIVECHDVDGEDCYILRIRTATPQSLRTIIGRLRAMPHVGRTVTSISLKTVKESQFRL